MYQSIYVFGLFGMLGLFVVVAACRMLRPRLARAAGASLAICLACSLLDQCHKLFVPGRHFDGSDLVMDAVGYGLAILVVVAWERVHATGSGARGRSE